MNFFATNELNLSPEALLAQYKCESVAEHRSQFLEGSNFAISDVLLKKVGASRRWEC